MKKVGVVTVARSDYGIYRPIIEGIRQSSTLELQLIAGGMHLSPEFGYTVDAIEADGFEIDHRVEMTVSSNTPQGIAKTMGLGLQGFGQIYAEDPPDLLLLLGDRYEMLAAGAGALPFNIPLAHIHGGEATHGLIDDPIRHSLTKMSHLHFVSTDEYKRRVVQMGEHPERVLVSGAPALDNLSQIQQVPPSQLENSYGFELDESPIVVTYHPVTLEHEDTESHVDHLLEALDAQDRPTVVTYPNADTKGQYVIDRLNAFVEDRARTWLVDNLGTRDYYSLLDHAAVMVGNSSSGIIEAASFDLPVVDVGNRQAGRVAGRNVIQVDADTNQILQAIERALDPGFQEDVQGMENPYGDGNAAPRIVETLAQAELDRALLKKGFHDIVWEGSP